MPERPSNTIKIAILLILLATAAGIVFFKFHFIPEPEIGKEPDKAEQTAVDMQNSAAPVTESKKETPAADHAAQPQTMPSLPAAPIDNSAVGHSANIGHPNRIQSLEERIEKEFQKKEGSHFTVKFEGGENAEIGHLIAIILEEAYIKVGSELSYYPEDRIEAVLYTRHQFVDVTKAPSWVGAIYDGRIKIPIGGITSRTNLLERVLFHEYTHALVHRLSKGKAPLWLNEGLAQYEEGSANENISQILTQVAKIEKPLSLRSFEGSFMGYNNLQASIAYSVSLSATTYIINEFGISAVKRILENIGEGKTMEEALSSSLYLSYEDFQKSWFMSLKRRFAG